LFRISARLTVLSYVPREKGQKISKINSLHKYEEERNMEQSGEGVGQTSSTELSRVEADMQSLLLQLASAAAQERSTTLGQERLSTIVTTLRTILATLHPAGAGPEGIAEKPTGVDSGRWYEALRAKAKRDGHARRQAAYLHLDSSAQEVGALLSLRIATPLR
jgi:hypothetical protein